MISNSLSRRSENIRVHLCGISQAKLDDMSYEGIFYIPKEACHYSQTILIK